MTSLWRSSKWPIFIWFPVWRLSSDVSSFNGGYRRATLPGGGGEVLQCRDRVKRAERLTAWGPRAHLGVPIGSRGKIPGGGAGGRAAAFPWAPGLSIWNAQKGSPVTLFFFHKMIDSSPKTEKSTLCHNIYSAQQTIEIIFLHGKQFGDCLRWRSMMNDTPSTEKSTLCCNISLDYTRNKENYLFAWKTIWDCLWCGGWLAPGGGCLRIFCIGELANNE